MSGTVSENKLRTVAVTGITGKSGQYFLRRLMENAGQLGKYRFKLLCRERGADSRNDAGYQLLEQALYHESLHTELCQVDLKDPSALEAVFGEPVWMVIHIASVKLSRNIVTAALKNGVDNFVLVHTTGIYSKYKAAGEEYRQTEAGIYALVEEQRRQDRDVALTVLRPTMIYGDLQDKNISTFIRMVDKLRLFPVVNGARYDLQPVWCKDLGEAYYDVFTHWDITKNKEYILSGGAPIQLRDMFREIGRQLGVKNTFVSCPFPVAYAGAWAVYLLSLKKVDLREKVQRLVEPRAYSHEAATRDFGYSPAEFSQGVSQEIGMYKAGRK